MQTHSRTYMIYTEILPQASKEVLIRVVTNSSTHGSDQLSRYECHSCSNLMCVNIFTLYFFYCKTINAFDSHFFFFLIIYSLWQSSFSFFLINLLF